MMGNIGRTAVPVHAAVVIQVVLVHIIIIQEALVLKQVGIILLFLGALIHEVILLGLHGVEGDVGGIHGRGGNLMGCV